MSKTKTFTVFLAIVGVTFLANVGGVVRFSYPRALENDPLVAPVAVQSVDGHSLLLADGRILFLGHFAEEDLAQVIRETGSRVDVGSGGEIYVSRRGWICGTPWATPIRLPIFADEIPINRRELLGFVKSYTRRAIEDRDAEPGTRMVAPSDVAP